MPANADTVLQLNFTTPGRTLINLYISDTELAGPIVDDVIGLAAKIKEAEDIFNATATVAGVLGGQVQPQAFPQAPAAAVQAPGPGPMCPHGQMIFKAGTSKAGNPYKMWSCPSNLKTEQGGCSPQWIR